MFEIRPILGPYWFLGILRQIPLSQPTNFMLSKGSPHRDSSIKILLSLIGLSIQDLWANESTDRLIKHFIFRQYKPHSHKSVQLRSLAGKERWRTSTRNRRSQWCCTGGR